MRRIHSTLHTRAAEFDTHKLGPNTAMALLTLADIEPAPIQALVRTMNRDKSQITRMLAKLEDTGLVRRAADPVDGRVTLLSTTEAGAAAVLRIQAAVAEVIDGILQPLPEPDRETLRSLLSRI